MVVETVHGKIQTLAVLEAVIATLDTSPVMLIVGVTAIASLKVAVMVTTLEPEVKLSESLSVSVTVEIGIATLKARLEVSANAVP